jgi:hypothetical protein
MGKGKSKRQFPAKDTGTDSVQRKWGGGDTSTKIGGGASKGIKKPSL